MKSRELKVINMANNLSDECKIDNLLKTIEKMEAYIRDLEEEIEDLEMEIDK